MRDEEKSEWRSYHLMDHTRLKGDFPNLYKIMLIGRSKDSPSWWIQYGGIECGLGWEQIIADLSEKIENLILELPEDERDDYYVQQIKSKFGGLRFYMSRETQQMSKAIFEAEGQSFETCENCSKPAVCQPHCGWVVTLCDEHLGIRAERLKERNDAG